jgi:putative oxidoreductase
MIDNRTAPHAILVLRIVAGVLLLVHAGLKLFVFTPAGTAAFFGSLGLPPLLAYLSIAWELATGSALILGLWPRVAALAGTLTPLGAIATVHGAAGFFFNNPNGGWEYPAFWIVALVVIALAGDGSFAFKPTPFLRAK